MNRIIERAPTATPDRTTRTAAVAARAAGRLQRWFRRSDDEQLNRELSLRLEERLKERVRIARELHDTMFQGLQGASLQLDQAVEQLPADSPGKPSLCHAMHLMHRVIDEGREALQDLRSSAIACMSIEQALSGLHEEFTSGGGVRFQIFVTGQPKALKPTIQEQVCLIAREALVNALRHSEATLIEAEVEYLPRRLRVVVRDNGCGIDQQMVRSGRVRHWDLLGMRERAASVGAELRIWSRLGAGTEVEICVADRIMAEAYA